MSLRDSLLYQRPGSDESARRFSTVVAPVDTQDFISMKALAAALYMIVNLGVAVTVYHFAEGWTWIDSLYFAVNTAMTVGYGDLYPVETHTFTTLFIWNSMFATWLLTAFLFTKFFNLWMDRYTNMALDPEIALHRGFVRRGIAAAACLVLVVSIGVFSFAYLEGWSLFDSLYFVTVSVSSCGIGDYTIKTPHGRLWLSIYLLIAATSVTFLLGAIVDVISRLDAFKRRLAMAQLAARAMHVESYRSYEGGGKSNDVLSSATGHERAKTDYTPEEVKWQRTSPIIRAASTSQLESLLKEQGKAAPLSGISEFDFVKRILVKSNLITDYEFAILNALYRKHAPKQQQGSEQQSKHMEKDLPVELRAHEDISDDEEIVVGPLMRQITQEFNKERGSTKEDGI